MCVTYPKERVLRVITPRCRTPCTCPRVRLQARALRAARCPRMRRAASRRLGDIPRVRSVDVDVDDSRPRRRRFARARSPRRGGDRFETRTGRAGLHDRRRRAGAEPASPIAAAPAFAEPAVVEAPAAPAGAAAGTAGGSLGRATSASGDAAERDAGPASPAARTPSPRPRRSRSEVKAAEKAQEKASGRAVVGDAGGEEKPKAKQENCAGR